MASIRYWNGTKWTAIASGVGGPPGLDGKSVNVYGPQQDQPVPDRKGDVWLVDVFPGFSVEAAAAYLAPAPEWEPARLAPEERSSFVTAELVPPQQPPPAIRLAVCPPKSASAGLATCTPYGRATQLDHFQPPPPAKALAPVPPQPASERLEPVVYSPASRGLEPIDRDSERTFLEPVEFTPAQRFLEPASITTRAEAIRLTPPQQAEAGVPLEPRGAAPAATALVPFPRSPVIRLFHKPSTYPKLWRR